MSFVAVNNSEGLVFESLAEGGTINTQFLIQIPNRDCDNYSCSEIIQINNSKPNGMD